MKTKTEDLAILEDTQRRKASSLKTEFGAEGPRTGGPELDGEFTRLED